MSIDTSTDYLAVAVTDGDRLLGRIHKKAPRSHSSLLMPTIDRLLVESSVKLDDIDGYCVGVGPGSFTGLRIGVATVKGLAFVTGKPIAAVPTFDAIAQSCAKKRGAICVVLDARKSKVYGCLYDSDGHGRMNRKSKYLLLSAAELLKMCGEYDSLYFVGDYAERMASLYGKAEVGTLRWHPRGDSVAKIGAGLFKKKKFVTAEKLEPMYIYSRECDITGV